MISHDAEYYIPMMHSIHLVGKLSVITLLHEFAQKSKDDQQRDAARFSKEK